MKKILALVAVATLMAFAAPAFAANPFMDVPMNHWAYDAIGQLASQGVVSGYPDGTFKGNQPMTRYEMASIVARALAVVDMDKASKQDVEMLKKLVVEFKDELDALGVQVDELDSRVSVLEENIGGWKIWGQFRMDWDVRDNGNFFGGVNNVSQENAFDLNRYRLYLSKQINDTTTFTTRIGNAGGNLAWERYYIDTVLGYDINLRAGYQNIDWEGDAGLYFDNDAWFTDFTKDAFLLEKDFGMADVQFFVAHSNEDFGNNTGLAAPAPVVPAPIWLDDDMYLYGLRADIAVNDKFRFALSGIMNDYENLANSDLSVYWLDFNFDFNSNVAFRGAYFMEDLDAGQMLTAEDSPAAYKVIVDVKQEAFGFTSAWIEYAMFEDGFVSTTGGDANIVEWNNYDADRMANRTGIGDTSVLFADFAQSWNDKWGTHLQYFSADYDQPGVDDTVAYTFGISYQLNPAVSFLLDYTDIDFGTAAAGFNQTNTGDDNQITLRTYVSF